MALNIFVEIKNILYAIRLCSDPNNFFDEMINNS